MPSFFDHSTCTPNGIYCRPCRFKHTSKHREHLLKRYGADGIDSVDFACPKGMPWDWKPDGSRPTTAPVVAPLTLDMMRSFTVAALGGEYVTPEVQAQREAICAACDMSQKSKKGLTCGVCGCGVDISLKRIRNLAAYVEKLDPNTTLTVMGVEIGKGATWGCKHPERNQGKGWPK